MPELSTDQPIYRHLSGEALSGQQEWRTGPPALPPSQGCRPQAGCAPSFLRAPLCHHGKPPRGPVHSRSAPGRQGLLGGEGSWQEDTGQARGCRMPLAWWGPRGQGCGEKSQKVKSQSVGFGGPLMVDAQDLT